MPIKPIVLQRRHAELGRIRLGAKEATSNGRTRPAKLGAFRFTSPSERYIKDLAELYGGTPQPWDNNGKPEFEVFTTATSIPVIAVKGGLSQWMETWSGGGCVHRCDGERTVDGELCENDTTTVTVMEDGKKKTVLAHDAARPTTRLSVMLPELEAIGVWRMESHGWNAAAEIPAVAELAQYVGDLVPAHLNLMERRSVKDGKTSRFVVPVLDLQIGSAKLREIVAQVSGGALPSGAGPAALEQGAQAAIASGPAERPDYEAQLAAAASREDVVRIWQQAKDAGHLTTDLEAACGARAAELVAPTQQPDDEPVEAVVVDEQPAPVEQDPDVVWQRILAVAGDLGGTTSQVTADFEQYMAMAPGEASAGELATYLAKLQQQGLDETRVPA